MCRIGGGRRTFRHVGTENEEVLITPKDQLEKGIVMCIEHRKLLAESCFDTRRVSLAYQGEAWVKSIHAKAIVLGAKDKKIMKKLYSPVFVTQKNYLISAMNWAFSNRVLFEGKGEVIDSLHARAIILGLADDDYIVGKLIGLYSKMGWGYVTAVQIFNRLEGKKLGAWTGILFAQATTEPGEAVNTFMKLEKAGIKPTELVCRAFLHAAGQSRISTKNLYPFLTIMIVKYGLEPDITHFGCLVNKAVKHEGMEKAFKFLDQLNIPLSNQVCCMVFGACMSISPYDTASANRMIEIVLRDGGDYWIGHKTYDRLRKSPDVVLPSSIKRMEPSGPAKSWIRTERS